MNVSINEVILVKKRFLENLIKGSAHIIHHILVVGLSGVLALSLPFTVSFIAKHILVYWSLIGNDRIFLVSLEMTLAILLILLTNYISSSWKDRKLSNMARIAGLFFVTPQKGFFARRRIRKLKEKEGFARDVMVIGSTGFRTFVDPDGDLHNVIKNCREAKIMLLDPYSEGAEARAKSILDPDITPENFGEQIKKSIDFLRELKAVQKNIKLKLYQDMPLLKLAIIGDYIWMQHYHVGLDVRMVPEYVFKHGHNAGSLYIPFYQYFVARWNSIDIPEYDLDSDELVYRDTAGNEVRREKFNKIKMEITSNTDQTNNLVAENHYQVETSIAPIQGVRRNRGNVEDSCTDGRQITLDSLHPRGKDFLLLSSKSPMCETVGWRSV
jgi:hypothetical protein